MPIGQESVVSLLQDSLRLHLKAIEAYAAQAAHFGRWGYAKLAEERRADSAEESGHRDALLNRLEYFDVEPEQSHDQAKWPRHDFEGVLVANLSLESEAAKVEREGVAACRDVGDEQSAIVFASLLAGSEAAIAAIEAAMKVVEQIGLDNYLSTKV